MNSLSLGGRLLRMDFHNACRECRPYRTTPIGVTLVELLVVFAILGTIFSLVLPAVQSARESARQVSCTNNLKQLAQAVLKFELRNGHFPPAYTDSDSVEPDRPKHNLIAFLLADLEQSSLAEQYSFEFNWYESLRPTPEQANWRLAETPLAVVKCPSTPNVELAGASDYAVCTMFSPRTNGARSQLLDSGKVTSRELWTSMLYPFDEVTQEFIDIKRNRIVDGLSNSMMLFEDCGRPDFYAAGYRISGSGKEPVSGALWADADAEFAVHDVCGSSFMNCNNGNEIYSFHPGSCNFAFGDASIRRIVTDIDPEVFVSLFTRNAGDIPGAIP